MSAAPRLLLVDDNEVDREHLQRLLGAHYRYAEAATVADALDQARAETPDCVLLDFRLPDRDGLEALVDLGGLGLPVVMLTGQGDETVAVEAMKAGAQDYLVKGKLDAPSLLRAVNNAIEKSALRQALHARESELHRHVEELEVRRADLERSHRALAERQERLDLLMRCLPAVVWTTDPALRYTSLTGASRLPGLEPAGWLGRQVASQLDDDDQAEQVTAAHRRALAGEPASCEVRVGDRWLQAHLEPLRDAREQVVGVIGVALDVSENRALQQQLLHAQKLDAVGQLAGGVAHDFNNILTAVISFTRFVLDDLQADHPSRPDVEEVLRAGERASALTRQLLAFSRKQLYEPQVVDVGELLQGLEKMLRRVLGEDVSFRVVRATEPGLVYADRGQLEQVVLNLAVNARDAMPGGGALTIEVGNVELDGDYLRGRLGAPAGAYVMLAVSDTGQGIPEALRERIFEPFFTTKPEGRGTGLGLATVYGFVKQAGGDIHVYSDLGRGTTFKLFLPLLTPDAVRATAPARPPRVFRGTERILVVEDEPAVRAVVRRALASAGFQVVEAERPSAALALLAEGPEVDLLVTDVVLPELNGRELVERARALRPQLRVLFMSGYTGNALIHQGLFAADTPHLQKPFTPEQLAERVRAVLDAPPSAPERSPP